MKKYRLYVKGLPLNFTAESDEAALATFDEKVKTNPEVKIELYEIGMGEGFGSREVKRNF